MSTAKDLRLSSCGTKLLGVHGFDITTTEILSAGGAADFEAHVVRQYMPHHILPLHGPVATVPLAWNCFPPRETEFVSLLKVGSKPLGTATDKGAAWKRRVPPGT